MTGRPNILGRFETEEEANEARRKGLQANDVRNAALEAGKSKAKHSPLGSREGAQPAKPLISAQ